MTKISRIAALAALFTAACAGEAGPAGSSGTDGAIGADGRGGQPCTVTQNADGGATITCPDGTAVTVAAPGGCTIRDNGDGTKTVSCADGTGAVISDGVDATRTPGDVSGQIVDPAGLPLAGVTAQLLGTPFTTTTGPDGRFRLLAVSAGVHELQLSHPYFGTHPSGLVVVDAGETRLGTIHLQAGALVAEGYWSSLGSFSTDGTRAIAERVFFRANGSERRRIEVADLTTGTLAGWPSDVDVFSWWLEPTLRGVILGRWEDPRAGRCALTFLDLTTGAERPLGAFDCNDTFTIRGERLSLFPIDPGGGRTERVEIVLATGELRTHPGRSWWSSLSGGDLYRDDATGLLVFLPLDGGAEASVNVDWTSVLTIVDAPAAANQFFVVWTDGTDGPSIGRFDTAAGALTVVVADAGTDAWGGAPIFAPGDGSVVFYGPRTDLPGAVVGDQLRLSGTDSIVVVCPGNQFGDYRTQSAERVSICNFPPAVPGEPGIFSARRMVDGVELASHTTFDPLEFYSPNPDWLFRYDFTVNPTTLEVISVADGNARPLSVNAEQWSWSIFASYVLLYERLPDGSPEQAIYRLSDLRRTPLPIDRSAVRLLEGADALITVDPTGLAERWALASGTTAWGHDTPAGFWFIGGALADAMHYLSPGAVHPELFAVHRLDLDDGRAQLLADGIGFVSQRAQDDAMLVAEGPFPDVETGRAPGLYLIEQP